MLSPSPRYFDPTYPTYPTYFLEREKEREA